MPFDPDQPRDEKGQWTAGSAASAIQRAASDKPVDSYDEWKKTSDAREAALERALDKKRIEGENAKQAVERIAKQMADRPVEQKLAAVEEVIRHQSYESLAVFDNNGNYVLFKDGDKGQVEVTPYEQGLLKDAYVTHNHPHDVSFSNGDFYTITALHGKEIRATTDTNTYVFRPNYEFSNQPFAWQIAIDSSMQNTMERLQDEIKDGKITQQFANKFYQDEAAKDLASQTDSFYMVIPNPKPKQQRNEYPNYYFFQPENINP